MVNFLFSYNHSNFQLRILFIIILFCFSTIAVTASVDEMSGELDVIHKMEWMATIISIMITSFVITMDRIGTIHFNGLSPGHL